ncbi:MAG TPA: hypothetical protein VEJ89_10620 [Myxococcaceae bacterium]|nr:hypothetical protein [Myxococcaceae bacterium]
MTRGRPGWASLAVLVLALPAAAEPAVAVVVEVVQASNDGGGVDAGLERMREQFAKSGISYKSYRRISREQFLLALSKPAEVKLPNGKTGTLTLVAVKGASAQVSVSLPPLQTVATLGREGSVYLQAGPHAGGVLILVLTPAGG